MKSNKLNKLGKGMFMTGILIVEVAFSIGAFRDNIFGGIISIGISLIVNAILVGFYADIKEGGIR
nr:MAG TPA: Protein of unknown function (DUF1056) [Caudoviricetes sp.]